MTVRFPNESDAYRSARERLLAMEIELRRSMEAVAEARRALPPGGLVSEDYLFRGADGDVRLSELFSNDVSTLATYQFMFPRDGGDTRPGPESGETAKLPLAEGPCPSCTALLDQLDGAAPHVAPHLNLVIIARAPIDRVLTFAKERSWRNLRFVSSGANAFARDYHGQTSSGAPMPMMNVFVREASGVRHFWGSELLWVPPEPGQDPRHVGTLEPMWTLFDLTPEGRGTNREEQLTYCCHH